jgi:UDP-2,4-diacetamido-2,4,6-trideoxy-beta-L-altropyranose hydrolase
MPKRIPTTHLIDQRAEWLLVRADANARIGAGHIMRALALAHAWLEAGGQVCFLSACDNVALAERVRSAGIMWQPLAADASLDDQVEAALAQSGRPEAAPVRPWVLLDGYHFRLRHQRAFKAAGYRVLCLDDLAALPAYAADLVVNQNVGAERLPYAADGDETEFLLGSRYAVLRPEFRSRKISRPTGRPLQNVLITFGGADPSGLTERAIRACQGISGLAVRVIVGPLNPNGKRIRATLQETGVRAKICTAVRDMTGAMAWADVALTAAGQTCWEMAHLGLPSLAVAVAENQMAVAAGVARAGVGVNLGTARTATVNRMRDALLTLRNRVARRAYARRGPKLIDGWGAHRIVDRMRRCSLTFRPAVWSDCRWIWELANEAIVRKASFHEGAIPFESHQAWFRHRLDDAQTTFWIAANDAGEPVGQVRFAKSDKGAIISVSVAPAWRKRGWGRVLIGEACEAYVRLTRCPIRALIRQDNPLSLRAFEAAGFRFQARRRVNSQPAWVLRWAGPEKDRVA